MSYATRALRLAVAAASLGSIALIGHANAAAPLTSKLYMRQGGCATTAEAGRLDPKNGADECDGYGTIGGVPLSELDHRADLGFVTPETYDTGKAGVPIKLDSTRKVTGQVASTVFWGDLPGGVGDVTFDITLTAKTTAGKTIEFGTKTFTAAASPTSQITAVPFSFDMPASAKGATLSKVSMELVRRGLNFNMQARSFNGNSFIIFPTRKK